MTYFQYTKRLAACSTYVQNYAIFPETPKLPSLRTPGPVFVHRQNNISPRNRSTQTDVSATLLSAYRVSLRFVNKYRLSDQNLAYRANGYSGGGCLIDPAVLIFWSLTGRLFLRSIHCLVRHLLPW